uniref:Putative gnk2-like domain-containing protein n=1 Tax=Helianthus annuus TaxID=4232 RepID=A0A251RS22_HELAN
MFILDRKLPLWLLSYIFIHLIHTTTLAQPDFLSYFCESAANYTIDSTYQRNLNTTLSTLPTTNNGLGFYNLTIGQGNDTVNSIALCRGDINLEMCRSCVNDSIIKLPQLCPNQKEAIGYYDNCVVKYSNEVILRNTRIKFYVYLANPQNATDIDQFNGALGPLLKDLRGNASAGGPLQKFASGSTSGPAFSTIYGLVQFLPFLVPVPVPVLLSLEDIINRIALYFNGRVGGRILVPMCTFRYETYRFFNQTARANAPSPPPILQPSPPIARPSSPPGMSYIFFIS